MSQVEEKLKKLKKKVHSFESFHFLVLSRWPEWFHFHRGVTPEAKFMISFNLPWKNISDGVNNRLEKMFSVKISLAESSPFWHSPFWHVPEGRIFNHTVVAWHWFTAKFCSNSFWSEGDEYFDALFFLIDSSRFFCFVPASVTTRITPLSGMLSRVTLTPGKHAWQWSDPWWQQDRWKLWAPRLGFLIGFRQVSRSSP